MAKRKLDELEFYGMIEGSNLKKNGDIDLRKTNIFGNTRVLRSVAMWVLGRAPKDADFLRWCFGDLDGRCEYELIVSPWPPRGETMEDFNRVARKVSVYEMYIVPNEKLLRHLINEVSKSSAQRWLTKDNKRLREIYRRSK